MNSAASEPRITKGFSIPASLDTRIKAYAFRERVPEYRALIGFIETALDAAGIPARPVLADATTDAVSL